jgi:signal transduction histidine kinase
MAIIKSNKSWFRQAHGGEIKVTTKEGEGTEFIIMLPVV